MHQEEERIGYREEEACKHDIVGLLWGVLPEKGQAFKERITSIKLFKMEQMRATILLNYSGCLLCTHILLSYPLTLGHSLLWVSTKTLPMSC